MTSKYSLVALVMLLALPGCATREARTVPDGVALADFDRRIKAYAALRDELEGGAGRLTETAEPDEIAAAERALAARIQEARATARRADIFTPPIERRFRSLLNPHLRGVRGQNTRGIIRDEGPNAGGFPFTVNGSYPKQQPLGSVPPDLLASLPPLPEDLEYRFIDKHLILRDARANLIVDFIPNAIS
ncbi:MAG: hypothetical protein HY657_17500 [Acidobacteria bacterium]|nr:hypothetical protein [Acidobacteriota bacterium]